MKSEAEFERREAAPPSRRFRSPDREETNPAPRQRSRSPPPRRGREPSPPRNRREPWEELLGSDSEEKDEKHLHERDASRERENRRRNAQAECVRRAGALSRNMQESAKQGLDTNYIEEAPRLFWDGFQWVAKAPEGSQGGDPALMNQTRKLRRLYFGNLPLNYGLTETAFQELVWQEMIKRGMAKEKAACPVICVWFAKDKGTYGFVEFASVEETDLALALDGMEVMGVNIKVSRPNDYATNSAPTVAGQPTGMPQAMPNMQGPIIDPAKASSPFVVLKGIIQPNDLEGDETWADCLEDVEEGCSSYGVVRASLIASPDLLKTATDSNVNAPARVGDVVLEFETPAVADQCVSGMGQKRFNQRAVVSEKLTSENFSLIAPLVGIAKEMNIGIFREGGSAV
eukprot:GHVH01000148.1.p1 GENE.GHVH01000148.1~~GHVH01000148.1.p1  ORF type:complete len:401 (+),score=57.72 GHVH01000148.1:62-1264(+)